MISSMHRDDLFQCTKTIRHAGGRCGGANFLSQRVLCSPRAAGTISFVWNELPHCLAGRLDACCYGYAWQPQNVGVSCPGTSSALPDRDELLEFRPVKHRKV
jgi:hypothetical protein